MWTQTTTFPLVIPHGVTSQSLGATFYRVGSISGISIHSPLQNYTGSNAFAQMSCLVALGYLKGCASVSRSASVINVTHRTMNVIMGLFVCLFVVVENVWDCKGQNVVDSHSLTLFSTACLSILWCQHRRGKCRRLLFVERSMPLMVLPLIYY